MELLIIWVFGIILFFTILYFVIKSAVRSGIIDADRERIRLKAQESLLNKGAVVCEKCGKAYSDNYWPLCPICGYKEN